MSKIAEIKETHHAKFAKEDESVRLGFVQLLARAREIDLQRSCQPMDESLERQKSRVTTFLSATQVIKNDLLCSNTDQLMKRKAEFLMKANLLLQHQVPKVDLYDDPEDEWETNEYVFKNYKQRRLEKEIYYSDPIAVEGCVYQFKFYPNGSNNVGKKGKDTHISVGIERKSLPSLKVNQPDQVSHIRKMIHSSGDS